MFDFNSIYEVVKKIPAGKVMTYQGVATKAGNPKGSRVVGNALHKNKDRSLIPCHRVVNRNGNLSNSYAFGGITAQRNILEKENVIFKDERTVNLEISLLK
ncbi:MAG: MGMT family protein [Acholeplasmatales bacterium]|jgi:methylated-DNA-protein-cysteine methyltransferase-like protein|nr:MGMT family protein [Acholeplasmatales bacterium]